MIVYASCTDVGGRPYNEDTAGVRQTDGEHLCAALADGLGGHGGGEIASREAVKIILDGWQGTTTPEHLCELIQTAHRNILTMQTPACKMKTTVVVFAVEPGFVQWAYVGDSRLYHFVNGRLVFQTRDHSASQIAMLMGQITAEEIRFHEDRSRLFRALGQENGMGVDAKEEKLGPGEHAFLLCSDGFWEYVYENEMEKTLKETASPEEWLREMKHCLDGRAGENNDNNTAIAVWVTA